MASHSRKGSVPSNRDRTTASPRHGQSGQDLVAGSHRAEPSRRLLDRVTAGDLAALGELYQEHAEMAYQLAFRMTSSVADAEDIVQDLFIGVPEALRSLKAAGSFRPWLRKCTVRVTLLHMRATRRRREIKLEPDWLAGSTPPTADLIDLETALKHLPDNLRIVVVLKEIEGVPHVEIAELLGITAAASRVRMMRARQMLRRLLAPAGPGGADETAIAPAPRLRDPVSSGRRRAVGGRVHGAQRPPRAVLRVP